MGKVISISILILFLNYLFDKKERTNNPVHFQTTAVSQSTKTFKFVIAESGLNYRAAPNGKILGKFEWKEKVEYLYDTDQTQKIIDNYNEVEGTWVAVKQKKDTVFVFDYYLSSSAPRLSRLKLYYAQPYYNELLKPTDKRDVRHAIVNVSESFYMPENFIEKSDLQKDTVYFTEKQRNEFLTRMKYSNRDSIFVYDLKSGMVKRQSVAKTPLMACINIYSQVSEEYKKEDYDQRDYQVAFDFGKLNYNGFAIIAKENPFIEKGLKPIIFEEMSQTAIEVNTKKGLISENWKNDTVSKYCFNYGNTRLFVKKAEGFNNWNSLIIKDILTTESITIDLSEGESSSLAPLKFKGDKPYNKHDYQYIGRLFKGKPAVVFGFTTQSFGCPIIDFIDKNELPIAILCDNRH